MRCIKKGQFQVREDLDFLIQAFDGKIGLQVLGKNQRVYCDSEEEIVHLANAPTLL